MFELIIGKIATECGILSLVLSGIIVILGFVIRKLWKRNQEINDKRTLEMKGIIFKFINAANTWQLIIEKINQSIKEQTKIIYDSYDTIEDIFKKVEKNDRK